MERAVRVAKWGNSLAIRLPVSVVEALELQVGTEVDIHIVGERALDVARTPSRADLLERLRKFRDRLPPDFKFDRNDANGR